MWAVALIWCLPIYLHLTGTRVALFDFLFVISFHYIVLSVCARFKHFCIFFKTIFTRFTMAATAIAQDEELDASMYPIAALLDDLKNEDLQPRLNATRRIKTIAEALGPERTRGELLPFITDTIDDEDDVLLVLTEELGNFVDQVGGPAYAAVLLPPLETLSTVEESMVREKAVEALCNLSTHVAAIANDDSRTLHVDYLLPLLHRLATGDWFTSRISACSLVSHVYQNLPDRRPELRADVLSMYKRLAHDDTPMVRRAAASNIAAVAKAVSLSSPEKVNSDLLTVFSKLVEDEQDSVRLLLVENAAVFANLLSQPASSVTPTSNDSADAIMASSSQTSTDDARPSVESAPSAPVDESSSAEMRDLPAATMSDATSGATPNPANPSGVVDSPSASSTHAANGPVPTANGNANGQERVVNMVRIFAEDKSWRVRYMIADKLPELCDALGPVATRSDLLPAYTTVLKDAEPEVRTAAAFEVTEFVKRVVALPPQSGFNSGLDFAISEIMPIVEQLVTDNAQHVRSALASNIIGLAPVLGTDMTLKHLVDMVLALLKDVCPEVRLNVIARLDKVSFIMSIDKLSSELLPAIVDLAEDKNWRVRLAIIERMALLATQLGKQFFEENGKLGELCISWLGDCVYSIREAAITNLKKLTEIFGVDWAKRHIVPQVLEMYDKSTNYLLRMTALHAIGVLSQVVAVETVEDMFLPIVTERASRDPVPNVRFCSAKTLNLVIPYVRQDARESKIRPCLLTLTDANEKDTDVNYFAQQALTKLGQSPCPT